jgi:serine phosphatase RsbU (regulator of sigma subunit)
MNFQNDRFGRQRMTDVFARGGESADVVAQNVLWEMRKHAGLARRNDDVTMIVARAT